MTDQTRQALDDFLKAAGKKPGEYLFNGRRGPSQPMTTRQYARLLADWVASIGLDPKLFGAHSLRRTKTTLIYRRTGNLRTVQLLLGHTKIESNCQIPRHRGRRRALDSRASGGLKYPGRADMLCPSVISRFGPIADICVLRSITLSVQANAGLLWQSGFPQPLNQQLRV